MKKVLIIGIKGMAGHLLFNYYLENKIFEVFGMARNISTCENIFNIDVSKSEEVEAILNSHDFDYVINCIGILNEDAENNPDKAIWFNSYFPHFLEKVLKNSQTKLIHISTDCVFSGSRGEYTEKDVKDGIGFYAQSKALGEIVNEKDLTIRTSIIGPEINNQGIGLFHWFMTQTREKILKGYSEAFWSGITTLQLAKVIVEAISQDLRGLIQIAPKHKIDKHGLLVLFNQVFRNNEMMIEPYTGYKINKSLVSIRTDFDYKVPGYQTMLEEQLQWIRNHPDLYKQYSI
ncbi:dTDP-4-dehydrorhamnose reductase family protein [Sphingobacterium gobiense]|uniref:dTDP-4-dehydrorhamnose reductase n=1 Tax=Sphingobacterium gobiense TaxID=1382456 RepID=A0A2S9JG66_9SPHI|nr:SDR family oxidoreductase [Sphingobacterium gobiense]PRD51955.1 NAD(P)-dependent oxidoreductase [Sphingobacterium gobiense]